MYDEFRFIHDFTRAYPAYTGKGWSRTILDVCWRTYQNSARSGLGALVIGRIERRDGSGALVSTHGLGDLERVNFGTTNNRGTGSVLWSQYWNVPLNDSWLMGGIHGCLPFYVASPRTEANLRDPTYKLTVTGREILGLTTFGYRLAQGHHPALGEVYECADRHKATQATFHAYETAFKNAPHDAWRQLIG